MSETERQEYNKANANNYDAQVVATFLHPNFQATSRIAITKSMQWDEAKADCNVDETVYEWETLGEFATPIDQINRTIWPENAKVLDFACGAGLVTSELLPNVGQVVGVDIAPEMIKAFNTKVQSDRAVAYELDLMEENNLDLDFDAAVCSLSFHHIPDTKLVTETLASHLKPKGWVFVMDFDGYGLHDQDFERNKNKPGYTKQLGIAEANMDPDTIASAFKQAGLQNVGVHRGFQLAMWFDDEISIARFFSDEQKAHTQTRVNKSGKTEYRKVVKLAVVAGQKV